jgi:nucleotide-binding universal stress UspA family protein
MSTMSAAPVVLATDGTPSTEGALRFAVAEATQRGAGLTIFHVDVVNVPPPPLGSIPALGPVPTIRPAAPTESMVHARHVLERAEGKARALAPDLSVSSLHLVGGRVRAIVDASADAQLVVMGRETRHGLQRVLTGATTAGVTSQARCPVVAVPADWHPRHSTGAGNLVVGIRREADAWPLMTTAYSWASARGASISVVHAWELPDPVIDDMEARSRGDEWQAVGDRMLDEALADWQDRHPDVPVVRQVVHGHPASVLMAAAQAADLLVVRRAHEHRPIDHLGATVRALLLACPTPVEVVPTRQVTEPDQRLVLEQSGAVQK